MKKLLVFLVGFVLLGNLALASKPRVVLGPGTGGANFRVPYHETSNRTLSTDTVYILTGWYFIDSTYTLNIPAGTLILGDSASGGTLIVKRGAKIFAVGTPDKPIIFTDAKPAGTRVPGDWGGVVLQGDAPTNRPTTWQAEGGFGTIPNTDAMYGGTNPHSNQGILKYVRIEWDGIAFSQDNETNGLTLCGVGDSTVLEYIQTSFANDDDVEMFGGTVNVRHYVGWRMLDDDIDTDLGWSGRMQFCYEVRDPNLFDASAPGASHGFESDGEPPLSPDHGVFPDYPHTDTRVSNVTIIGPASDTNSIIHSNPKWTQVAMLRRGTKFSVYNSILVAYPEGVDVRDTLTQRCALLDSLEIRNTSIQSRRKPVFVDESPATGGHIAEFAVKDSVTNWFMGRGHFHATGNLGGDAGRQPIDVGVRPEAFHLDKTNNGIPLPGSEAATAPAAFDGRLAGDTWYDTTAKFRGAFDPALPRESQWDYGWTNYDPQNYDPEAATIASVSLLDGWNMISLPFVNTTDQNDTTVFATRVSNAFAYNGGYVQTSSLVHGVGYWAKFNSAQSSFLTGTVSYPDSITLVTGWNLIGSFPSPVNTSALSTSPAGLVNGSNFFGYNGSYNTVTQLTPGYAFWVRSSGAGKMFSSGASVAKQSAVVPPEGLSTLTVHDKNGRNIQLRFGTVEQNTTAFELPPVPPVGAFDARFSSNRYVESVPSDLRNAYELRIRIQGTYPISVSIDPAQLAGRNFELLEISDGTVVGRHQISRGSVVPIGDNSVNSLVLRITNGVDLPTAFSLGQNYPNPFNPTTAIQYQLPSDSRVSVKIFDVAGNEVKTLVNENQNAGFKSVEWNSTNNNGHVVASGVYFYRLTATSSADPSKVFVDTKKMMLLK